MIKRYAEQIFNIFNFVDSVIITDEHAKIQYYKTIRKDINNIEENEIVGWNILDAYTSLTRETSTIYRVLETGQPIMNEPQAFRNYRGETVQATTSTLPIFDAGKIVGAVDVSSYDKRGITLSTNYSISKNQLYTVSNIITDCPEFLAIIGKIPQIANTDSSVLIHGETGTGKELVAQAIFAASHRSKKRFISQNCAAIPSSLLESILFGTVKGSFTGAENRPGLFELANGGVLFLDEINSMELNIQPKILKAIEDKKITRVGSNEPLDVDVKIISAVNEDPFECIAKNKLRKDLYYRLSVVQLSLPTLRHRLDDIDLLVRYFINSLNEKMNRDIIDIDEEVGALFKSYSWPGNVRELKNIIEGAFNLTSSRFIQIRDLPGYMQKRTQEDGMLININCHSLSLGEMVGLFERKVIIEALRATENYVCAAKKLKISKQALNYKIKKYSIKQRGDDKFV